VVSPTWLFISHLKIALKECGISYNQIIVDSKRNLTGDKVIFSIPSKPLSYMVNRTLKISDNLYQNTRFGFFVCFFFFFFFFFVLFLFLFLFLLSFFLLLLLLLFFLDSDDYSFT
jgi:hypothetical protein